MTRKGMAGNTTHRAGTTTWLTPVRIVDALGGASSFDLDPCAAPEPRPWPTALAMNAHADANGLLIRWYGRVWLNPPYTAATIRAWLRRLADHGRGTALIFARTDTEAFHREVWDRAHGLLFLRGRVDFHRQDGSVGGDGGAPSVLCAYGQDDLDRLAAAGLEGALVPLRFARFLLVDGLGGTWGEEVRRFLEDQAGPVSLAEAYRHFARHPKSRRNPNWQAKVRQQLQAHGRRVGRARWDAARDRLL